MPAAPGNNYAGYTLEEIKPLCKLFAQHIAEGLSDTCFVECDYRLFIQQLRSTVMICNPKKAKLKKQNVDGRFFGSAKD